ncbi:YbfB/YjiJ family MFS transporter [Camelimonas sp. ID_303_24]
MSLEVTPERDGAASRFRGQVLTALGLSAGAAVALGLSRFAYGLLLPPMRADLGWTYVEAGALNTANGAGYIGGALVAALAARRWGAARAFIAGYAVSVLILLLTAATGNFLLLFTLRTLGGFSTAFTFILGAALTSAICPAENPRRRGLLVGLYMAGVSIAVLLSGAVVPFILQAGPQRWPEAWAALGGIGVIGLPFAIAAARRVSEPAGRAAAKLDRSQLRQLAPTVAGYGLFGVGYVGYMTFIMVLLQSQGGSSSQMIWFWFVLGVVSAVSNLVWGRVLGAFDDGRGPAMVFAIAMIGALPVLLYPGPAAMFLSAVIFGGSFMAGPSSITIVVQRQLEPACWTAAISLLTVFFAFGQAIGPLIGGAISDAAGSVAAGFWTTPVLLGIAACASLLQRPPARALSGQTETSDRRPERAQTRGSTR